MRRAIVERSEKFQPSPPYLVKYPKFLESSVRFEEGREEMFKRCGKGVPSPAGKLRGLNSISEEATVKIVLSPFWKVVYSKRKEFAPFVSKFFPSRLDPFSDRVSQKLSIL